MDFFSRFFTITENFVGRITGSIEQFSYRHLLAPYRWLLAKIDPLSYAIEGTVFKKILQVTIFPVFIVLILIVGFELVENGYHARYNFFGAVVTLITLGILFAPLERLIPFSRNWLLDKDEPTDIMVFFGNHEFQRFLGMPLQLATIALVIEKISPAIGQEIWPANWHPIVQVFLLLTVADFFRYWYHRWEHENEFMWRWHSVHHSSERLYWFNGNRVHPLEPLVQAFFWAIPLAFVKAPVEIVFVTGLLRNLLSRFQHTNMDLILGPFDYIFSTPKNHRYHHSKKTEEGNSNYAGDVIIWDILFGTFYLPKGQEPSDDIGVAGIPNYPQTWLGLMLAPFTYQKMKREAEKMGDQDASIVQSIKTDIDNTQIRKQA